MPANALVSSYLPSYEDDIERTPILTHQNSSVNSKQKDTQLITTRQVSPRKCVINSVMIALVYFFAFSGFGALRNLESSIDRLGEISLSVLSISAVIGAYMSPLVVYILGEKGCVVGMWTLMAFLVGANFYPVGYTLFPGAAMFGFMAGPGWTAQLSYTTNTAIKYASLMAKDEEELVEVSNGIFYLGYSSSQVVGNLISSLVLMGNVSSAFSPNASQVDHCGVHFCPVTGSGISGSSSSQTSQIPQGTLYGLFGVFLSGPVLAILASAIFLDPVQIFLSGNTVKKPRGCRRWKDEFLAPIRLFKDVRMILLMPAIFYSGIEQIQMFAGFTEAFVSCAIGVDYVGYIMICWGLCSAASSLASGILVRCFGRPCLCLGSLVLGLAIQVFLCIWTLKHSSVAMFFAVSGAWGVADGILQTQLSALLGLVFKENHNSAFASFRMLSYLGYAVTYAAIAVSCQIKQIYVTSAIIGVSIIFYTVLEVIIHRAAKAVKSGHHRIQTQYQSA